MPSFWSHYKGQSIGRVLHFLYHYCNLHIAENVTVGDGEVRLHGDLFATYVWEDDVPNFMFVGENAGTYQITQTRRHHEIVKESAVLQET